MNIKALCLFMVLALVSGCAKLGKPLPESQVDSELSHQRVWSEAPTSTPGNAQTEFEQEVQDTV